jgi:hypothetical protein
MSSYATPQSYPSSSRAASFVCVLTLSLANPGGTFAGIIQLADPIEACEALSGHYSNKIVLAKRGTCEFCKKAKSAQAAGAQAIMVANNDESLIHMTVGTCGNEVTIPSIMVPHSVGEELQHAQYTAASVMFPACRSGSPLKPGTCTLTSLTFAEAGFWG